MANRMLLLAGETSRVYLAQMKVNLSALANNIRDDNHGTELASVFLTLATLYLSRV
jgi:hypothetical protein